MKSNWNARRTAIGDASGNGNFVTSYEMIYSMIDYGYYENCSLMNYFKMVIKKTIKTINLWYLSRDLDRDELDDLDDELFPGIILLKVFLKFFK